MAQSKWNYTDPMGSGEDFEVYHLTDYKQRSHIFHSHPFLEFYFFLSGDHLIGIEDYSFKPETYDVCFFPSHYMHRNLGQRDCVYERFYFYISTHGLDTLSTPEFDLKHLVNDMISKKLFRAHLKQEDFHRLQTLVFAIIDAEKRHTALDLYMNRCRMGQLVAETCTLMQGSTESKQTIRSSVVNQVMGYINNHLTEEISLDLLSDLFFISKYHLLREFKDYTNLSIHQYILHKRILLAKELLLQGTKPCEVCKQCGFTDYASFYRNFHKVTKRSPSEWLADPDVTGNE